MKKKVLLALACVVMLSGCKSNSVTSQTTAAASAAIEETTVEDAVETSAEEVNVEVDGTQPEAEIEQPTLSEAARKAVEESIAAMMQTASAESDATEPQDLPTSMSVSSAGVSFDFPIDMDGFKSVMSGFSTEGNDTGTRVWAQVDELNDVPYYIECEDKSAGGLGVVITWSGDPGYLEQEFESLWTTPSGHYMGEPVDLDEMLEQGYKRSTTVSTDIAVGDTYIRPTDVQHVYEVVSVFTPDEVDASDIVSLVGLWYCEAEYVY